MERSFPNISFQLSEVATAFGYLFTTDTGNGGEHTARLHETGITACLDVLKRVVGHAFDAFESGISLETIC